MAPYRRGAAQRKANRRLKAERIHDNWHRLARGTADGRRTREWLQVSVPRRGRHFGARRPSHPRGLRPGPAESEEQTFRYCAFLSYATTMRRRPSGCMRRSRNIAFPRRWSAGAGQWTDPGAAVPDFPRPPRAGRVARPWQRNPRCAGEFALPDRAVLARRRAVALDQRRDRQLQDDAARRLRAGRDHRRRAIRQRRAGPRGARNASRRRCAKPMTRAAGPRSKRAEPIAADLRDSGDGERLGLLKIVAGMLGVGLDEIVQRDAARRQKRLHLIAAASVIGMAVTSTLAVVAIDARDAARDQRREAEGLVGFMLGDLRQKLEPIGRLDALDAVGARALGYYRGAGQGRPDRRGAGAAGEGADPDGRDIEQPRRPRRRAAALPRGDGGDRRGAAPRARRPAADLRPCAERLLGRRHRAAARADRHRRAPDARVSAAGGPAGGDRSGQARMADGADLRRRQPWHRAVPHGTLRRCGSDLPGLARGDRAIGRGGAAERSLSQVADRDAGVAGRCARAGRTAGRGPAAARPPGRAARRLARPGAQRRRRTSVRRWSRTAPSRGCRRPAAMSGKRWPTPATPSRWARN